MQTNTFTSREAKKSTMDIFKEIKIRNEALKINTYNQLWEKNSGAQIRLLSFFDSEKGKMKMAFL